MKKLVLIWLVLLAACHTSEQEIDPNILGYSYFPLEEGQFAIYDVQETAYSITADPVTNTYQVKEVVASKFTDLSNQEAFQIHRYIRSSSQDLWKQEPDSVWTAKIDRYQATRTENNVTFIKIIFPAKQNVKWDGNRLNNLGKEEYSIEAFKKPFQVEQTNYENTLTVIHSNVDDLCNKNVRYEVYAENVGLIYREKTILAYRQFNNQCDTEQNISFGTVFTQKLIESGKE